MYRIKSYYYFIQNKLFLTTLFKAFKTFWTLSLKRIVFGNHLEPELK